MEVWKEGTYLKAFCKTQSSRPTEDNYLFFFFFFLSSLRACGQRQFEMFVLGTIVFLPSRLETSPSIHTSIIVRIIPLSSWLNMCQFPWLSRIPWGQKMWPFIYLHSGPWIIADADSVYGWWINKQEGSKGVKWEKSAKWNLHYMLRFTTPLLNDPASPSDLIYSSSPRIQCDGRNFAGIHWWDSNSFFFIWQIFIEWLQELW